MQKALKSLPGVRDVDVNFEMKLITVSLEPDAKGDDSRFIKALEDAGFGGTINKTGTE